MTRPMATADDHGPERGEATAAPGSRAPAGAARVGVPGHRWALGTRRHHLVDVLAAAGPGRLAAGPAGHSSAHRGVSSLEGVRGSGATDLVQVDGGGTVLAVVVVAVHEDGGPAGSGQQEAAIEAR